MLERGFRLVNMPIGMDFTQQNHLYMSNIILSGPKNGENGKPSYFKSSEYSRTLQVIGGRIGLVLNFALGKTQDRMNNTTITHNGVVDVKIPDSVSKSGRIGSYYVYAEISDDLQLSFDMSPKKSFERSKRRPSSPELGDYWFNIPENKMEMYKSVGTFDEDIGEKVYNSEWVVIKRVILGHIGVGKDGYIYSMTSYPMGEWFVEWYPDLVEQDGLSFQTDGKFIAENASEWANNREIARNVSRSSVAMNAVASNAESMTVIGKSAVAMEEITSQRQAVDILDTWSAVNPNSIANTVGTTKIINEPYALSMLVGNSDYMGAVSGSTATMNVISSSTTAMNAVASSSTAMNIVASSSTAMNIVASSSTAMNAVASSSTARNIIKDSTTAMNVVGKSSMAIGKLAIGLAGQNPSSYADMNAVASSTTAMSSIAESNVAVNAVKSSSTAINAMNSKLVNVQSYSNSSTGRSGTIRTWTVPQSGVYKLTVKGAEGGSANSSYPGGKGAVMSGLTSLTKGSSLKILVGHKGINQGYGSSGGGGTFVAINNSPLIVAGGGGGASSDRSRSGMDASTSTSGTKHSEGYSGGTNGKGGQSSSGTGRGAGGGGFSGDGQKGQYNGGQSFLSGGLGGSGGREGGFGGGGSGTGTSPDGGGGGGGYSGGGGGPVSNSGYSGGGGGGSFISAMFPLGRSTSVSNTGHGHVQIQRVGS